MSGFAKVAGGIKPSSGNPLLASLPAELKLAEVAAWLDDGRCRQPEEVSQVREWIESALVATPQAVRIASALLRMMRRSAHDQDPRLLANRRRAIGLVGNRNGVRAPTASGICVAGDTGVGKSHIVQHVLQRVVQVVDHGPNDEANMLGLDQLVHLTIQLSGDGTPKAFFLNAIYEMDRILGTDYASRPAAVGNSGRNTVMSYFMQLVKKHRLLLLVIEEGQRKNLGDKKFRKTLDDLVIQLMNYGVPVAVLGNPLGISALQSEAQAQRRLCGNGDHRIDPVFSWSDPLWREYVRGIWDPTPLPDVDGIWCQREKLERLLWQCTGGFPGLLARLREFTLCNAWERDATNVDQVDLERAMASEEYAGLRAIAEPFVKRDVVLLRDRFKDINCTYYSEIWAELQLQENRKGALREQAPKAPSEEIADPPVPPREALSDATSQGQLPRASQARKQRGKEPCNDVETKIDDESRMQGPIDARSDEWIDRQPTDVDLAGASK